VEDLTRLPNIGAVLAEKLNTVGIYTYEDLAELGSVETILKIREDDPGACYNMLYALEGAIQKVRWHALPKEERQMLKKELDHAKGWGE
jgi:DNA transformation protein